VKYTAAPENCSVGEPAEGSLTSREGHPCKGSGLSPGHPCLLLTCCFGGPAAKAAGGPFWFPGQCPPKTFFELLGNFLLSELYANAVVFKTFNNGSLGSGIDEERSEMR
jgi:hypothetical protein